MRGSLQKKRNTTRNFSVFSSSAGVFSSERAQKMLQNEVLDVRKLADTAENEFSQISKIWKIWDRGSFVCSKLRADASVELAVTSNQ